MSEDIKNTANQISRSANGKWHVFWRGLVAYTNAGKVREFDSEQEARQFLVRCDAAERIVD
jgi:hypothetical protein